MQSYVSCINNLSFISLSEFNIVSEQQVLYLSYNSTLFIGIFHELGILLKLCPAHTWCKCYVQIQSWEI